MRDYQERLARLLAESRAFFFQDGLRLKDGRPSPYFVNLGVLRTGRLSRELGRAFADWMADEGLSSQVDCIIGPSYKGSAIAQAAAMALWEHHGREVSFDYDRKEAKTHGEATGHGYLFVTGAALQGGRVLVMDDVGTSMATKQELIKKISWLEPRLERPIEILGVSLAVDRQQVQAVYDGQGRLKESERGPDALKAFQEESGLSVWSLLGIREMVEYLHDQGVEVLVNGHPRALDQEIMDRFYDYLRLYGREEVRP